MKNKYINKADFQKSIIEKVRPFEGKMLDQVKDYFRVETTWASNALEGNTLTLSETKVLIEDGLTVGGKPLRDLLEAVGHAEAYDFIFTLLKNKNITEENVKAIHYLFYKKIDEKEAGNYRQEQVVITGSNYPVTLPQNIKKEMEKLSAWIKSERSKFHPIEFAAELHKKFVFIHPFSDGNGRTARLLMNLALMQDGYLPAIIPFIRRVDYIGALEKAHRDPSDFITLIAEMETEEQKSFIRLLGLNDEQQISKEDSSWELEV
ncbi:MAG: Fic family protein [Eubacteriaceae bacterium]